MLPPDKPPDKPPVATTSRTLPDQTSGNPADGTKEYLFPGGPVANTGFSATLLKHASGNNYDLSFRCTEFKIESEGGDRARDGAANRIRERHRGG